VANTSERSAQSLSRKDIEAKIAALAWQDEDFRKKFVADPKGQFEEKLGIKLPDNLKITAHQEDDNSLHFVIPMKPTAPTEELSDADLERVAGGVAVNYPAGGGPLYSIPTVVGSPMVPGTNPWG
jgi:hypothetical protein